MNESDAAASKVMKTIIPICGRFAYAVAVQFLLAGSVALSFFQKAHCGEKISDAEKIQIIKGPAIPT